MDRRDLLKRTGAVTAGAALGGGGIPAVGLGVAAVAAQDTEFDVWTTYNESDGIRAGVIDDIGAAFGEANGVTFAQRKWALEELQDTLPRAVDSDQGPDVAQVNNGESLAGPMARGGQILTLKDYDTEYGWSDRFAAGLLARAATPPMAPSSVKASCGASRPKPRSSGSTTTSRFSRTTGSKSRPRSKSSRPCSARSTTPGSPR